MATWVTHLMIADSVLRRYPDLDRRGFCVGNIAPDCNIENEDWTRFEPSREITHWMRSGRKAASDADAFCEAYIIRRKEDIKTREEYAFLLGYYVHLIVDAEFQAFIRDEKRVENVWKRIRMNKVLCKRAEGYDEDWDSVKKLIPKDDRYREIEAMEAEYLRLNPDSGYLTEILPLVTFPDYIDYMPEGCIVRKIGVMGKVPVHDNSIEPIAISKEEYAAFVKDAIDLALEKLSTLARIPIGC